VVNSTVKVLIAMKEVTNGFNSEADIVVDVLSVATMKMIMIEQARFPSQRMKGITMMRYL